MNLILAITLNTIIQKSFVNKWNIFMSAVVITTFSTAGYIALASYWGYAIIRARINFLITGILFTVFIVASLFVYQTQEFLGEKIDEHLYVQSEYVKEGETMGRGRIFAAGISARIALQNAFFGRGAITGVQEEGVYGYGLFDIFRRFGIIFGILYTFWFYRGLRRIADYYNYKKGVLALMIPLNLALASQAYNFYMPFILMVIIGLYNGRLNPREM
ncbi:MAG: hypothetical protein WC383_16280 [Gammaproteobacteria bacterium]